MANAAVKVFFELGHEASIRVKKTAQGFTHNWTVYVRGVDNADINCFVEKIVFRLHHSFKNPNRVVKEPPYVVRETGYAGFLLPIDIYLKNKEEAPINLAYFLTLQDSGQTIRQSKTETHIFNNPSEDFRRKLLKGGGVPLITDISGLTSDKKTSPPDSRKNKKESVTGKQDKSSFKMTDPFSTIFGDPIQTSKIPLKAPKSSSSNSKSSSDKTSHAEKGHTKTLATSSKHAPSFSSHKEKDKDKDKEKEKERDKEKEKEKEKAAAKDKEKDKSSGGGSKKETSKKGDEKSKNSKNDSVNKKSDRKDKEREKEKDGKKDSSRDGKEKEDGTEEKDKMADNEKEQRSIGRRT